jgi:hypothetical protein
VAHTWDFLDCDGDKHFSCLVKEYDDDRNLINEYWRGFRISEDMRQMSYSKHKDWVEAHDNFAKDSKLLNEKPGFRVDRITMREYRKFFRIFCSDAAYRERYNLRHERVTRPALTGKVDEKLVNVISKLNELGISTNYSCQGTVDEWTDYPSPTDGHSELAYISFARIPPALEAEINKCIGMRVEGNTVSTTDRKYNGAFAEQIEKVICKTSY